MAQRDQVDARPRGDLAREDGGDAVAGGKVAEGPHVHGEAAAVGDVLRAAARLAGRAGVPLLQGLAAAALQVDVAVARPGAAACGGGSAHRFQFLTTLLMPPKNKSTGPNCTFLAPCT